MTFLIPVLTVLHGLVTIIMGVVPNPESLNPKIGEFVPNYVGARFFKDKLSPGTEEKVVIITSLLAGLCLVIGGLLMWMSQPLGVVFTVVGALTSLVFLIIYFSPIMLIGVINDLLLVAYVLYITFVH